MSSVERVFRAIVSQTYFVFDLPGDLRGPFFTELLRATQEATWYLHIDPFSPQELPPENLRLVYPRPLTGTSRSLTSALKRILLRPVTGYVVANIAVARDAWEDSRRFLSRAVYYLTKLQAMGTKLFLNFVTSGPLEEAILREIRGEILRVQRIGDLYEIRTRDLSSLLEVTGR